MRRWSCLVLTGPFVGRSTADRDVAEGAAGAYFDRIFARFGTLGSIQIILHMAEACVEVQPGGDAVADSDVDLAEGGLREDGTTRHLAEADVAVGGLGSNRGVSPVDNDLAIGRVHPEIADGLADPGVSVGGLDHCDAVEVADPHGAGARPDLG